MVQFLQENQMQWSCANAVDFHFKTLYPRGHFGLTSVTFLVSLPLMQVIVFFLASTAIGSVLATAAVGSVKIGLGLGDRFLKLIANCGDE